MSEEAAAAAAASSSSSSSASPEQNHGHGHGHGHHPDGGGIRPDLDMTSTKEDNSDKVMGAEVGGDDDGTEIRRRFGAKTEESQDVEDMTRQVWEWDTFKPRLQLYKYSIDCSCCLR